MQLTRRSFAKSVAALLASLGVPPGLLLAAEPQSGLGISHTADSIRQEGFFKASPARLYAALTVARQFDGIVKLSDAMKTMPLKHTPSVIGTQAGSAFALFGGYITGRQIELVPNTRIVQVWRAGSWKAGDYSLVKFEFSGGRSTTNLVLTHTGFPAGEAQHLAEGWKGNYFEPLAKFLG